MSAINTLPVWGLAALIFLLRVVDVSLGTLRTITVVHGRMTVAVGLGFVEILIWVTAISQVILRLDENPLLALAYAGGFAAGNACGISLERHLALGSCVIRMITGAPPDTIAAPLRRLGAVVTAFPGHGRDGPRTLLFTTCRRRDLQQLLDAARSVDPQLFYTVERFTHADHASPLPHPTGWRAVLKKK